MKSLVLLVVTLSALFQFIAAFMAIRLIRASGALVAWVFLAAGFLLMGMRRVVTITHIWDGLSRGDLTAEIIACLISLLLLCGISMIGALFARIKRSQDELSAIHQELGESEVRYRTVADFTSDWEFWLAPDGSFKYVSPSCLQVCGYSAEEFYRDPKLLLKIIHPEDLPRYQSHTHGIQENGQPQPIDFRITTRDGQVRWIAHVCRTIVGTDGSQLGQRASNRDITERKRVETELRESEQRYRELNETLEKRIAERNLAEQVLRRKEADLRRAQEIAKLGSWRYDLTDPISWSDELYRIYGVSPDTFTPTVENFLKLIHPDDRPAMQAWIQACSADEKPGELEFRIILPDGTVRFISGRGELFHDLKAGLYLTGTGQDITERKLAAAALAESESAFRATFEQAAVGMARVALDGRWLQVNQRLCEVIGYSRDELLGLTFQDITHPDDLESDFSNLREMIAGSLESFSVEQRYIRKDRSVVWINLTVGLVRDYAGAPDYFTWVVEDISKRKRAEEALADKQRLLEELNQNLEKRIADAVSESREKDRILMQQGRQAAMGEMIGNIAHQWRQPLNTLGLIVQELLMTYGREEFNKDSLEANVKKAMRLISHMSSTIEDFRNYFRPDKEKVLFNVKQAVDKTLSLIEPSLKGLGITIEVTEKGVVEINGYPNEYSQVLLNILINCRDAYEACPTGSQRVVVVTILKENNGAVVTVADNAGGIPEKILEKIFDPYFSTKGPDKGTGIGLYMAKTIIEKNMGGRLTVRNTAGGAEFRIEV